MYTVDRGDLGTDTLYQCQYWLLPMLKVKFRRSCAIPVAPKEGECLADGTV